MWIVFLSIKYFFAKRKEGMISLISGISVVGVALGVASLIIVISIMNGFDGEVRKKIIGTYAHLMIFQDGGMEGYRQVADRIEEMPGVKNTSAFVTGQVVLRAKDTVTGILLKGVDPTSESEVTDVIDYIGGTASVLNEKTIVLGSELMRREDILVGDTVELLIPYSVIDMEKAKLKVIGTFTSGRYDYDANLAIVGLDTARNMFRMGDKVSGIALKVEDEMRVGKIKRRLQDELGYPYTVKSWMDLDRNLVSALAMEKKMMFIILALIVMVACFNISSSLIMMVMEKTRDIGILKAIGANFYGVSSVFFLVGSMVGVLGVAVGGTAGVFIATRINKIADLIERLTGVAVFPNDVYYFSEIPVNVSMPDVCVIISLAMALTLAAGIYPAWKASRMDPVEAIRYE